MPTTAKIAIVLAASALFALGCGARKGEPVPVQLAMLAVLPLEAAETQEDVGGSRGPLPTDAGPAVTAQVYGVLADQTRFRFVPDLTVGDALRRPVEGATLVDRAVSLGKEVGADGVIFGRVFRFRERVGGDLGATEPASVSFELNVVQVATGDIVWRGDFDRTQQSLSGNFLEFWMFWEKGPRWFTARDLAGLGVEKLLKQAGKVAVP